MSEHEHSATLGALAKALAAAQAKMGDAKKDATNPHFKNRYATLAAVRDAVTEKLSANGLAVTQTFEAHGEAGVCIVTTLLHESGEWLKSRLFIPVGKRDAQGFGSAISYGRRYSLAAICGIASDDDDDAEAAVGKRVETNGTTKTQPTDDAEALLTKAFDSAVTSDDIANAEAAASKAAQSGALSGDARVRLRERRARAVQRVSS